MCTEKTTPLFPKLEPGKYYRSRIGKKMLILTDRMKSAEYPVLGTVVESNGKYSGTYFYTPIGQYILGETSPHDIVGEWWEPIAITGWVNVYSPSVSPAYVYPSREAADSAQAAGRIDCVEVRVTDRRADDEQQ